MALCMLKLRQQDVVQLQGCTNSGATALTLHATHTATVPNGVEVSFQRNKRSPNSLILVPNTQCKMFKYTTLLQYGESQKLKLLAFIQFSLLFKIMRRKNTL